MKTIIKELLLKKRELNSTQSWSKMEIQAINSQAKGISLTRAEKKSVKCLWGQIDEPYYKAIKSLVSFDARYCSNKYYVHKILPLINPLYKTLGFRDKNLYDSIYSDDELRFPEALIRNIKGIFFDKDMRIINEKQAAENILSVSDFIIKPSVESGGGKNIKKVSSSNSEIINNLFREYKQNFIVQKIVEQHPLIAEFNETSLNSFRITTLFLNGKISICSRIFKFGKKDSFTDNANAGGFIAGLDERGNLKKIAYNKSLSKMEISREIRFPFYPDLENLAIAKHIKYFPHIGILGWDLSVDVNSKPICIEINTVVPGIFSFQFLNGPIFGERTEEVIDYAKIHKKEILNMVIL